MRVDFIQLLARLEGAVVVDRGFPRHALGARHVAAAQDAFLRILGHMRDLAAELAGRTNVDQRQAGLAVLLRILEKRTDVGVAPHGRHRIVDRRIVGFLTCEWAPLGHPFVAPTVHDFHVLVPEEPEDPEGVAGPPVRFVAVENARRVRTDTVLGTNGGEFLRRYVVTDGLVLQVTAPVDVHGAGKMPGIVEKDVLVAFHDADRRILQMCGDPVGRNEGLGMCVVFLVHIVCCGPEGTQDSHTRRRLFFWKRKPSGLSFRVSAEIQGGVAERLNAPVLKTGEARVSVGSNPTPSGGWDESAAQRHRPPGGGGQLPKFEPSAARQA